MTQPPARLRIQAFGPMLVTVGDGAGARTVTLPRVMEAILGFLVAQPHSTASREHLAWHLWGDVGNEQARQNLRQALHRLKKLLAGLGGDVLLLRDQSVSLDVNHLDCAVLGFPADAESDDTGALERAVAAYRGPFLDGVQTGRETFDDWLRGERARFERLATRAIREVAARHASRGDPGAAVALHERLHAMDPLNEDVHRVLLAGIAAHAGRSAALKRGRELAAMLRSELDCDPAPETVRLLSGLRDLDGAGLRGATPVGVPAIAASGHPDPGPPSLAVMPFDVAGASPATASIADGLTQDIATALSRLRWLEVLVPARPADPGRGPRARYLITGRVRTEATRLRITVSLVEAASTRQLWSERFDRDSADLFAVQDEIASRAAALVEPLIYAAEGRQSPLAAEPPADTWALVMQATGLVHRFERQPNRRAQELLGKAIVLEPEHARAHAVLAWAKLWAFNCRWVRDKQDTFDESIAHAETALRGDRGEPWCHMVVGFLQSSARRHDEALDALDVAVSLNPSFALARMLRGWALVRAGAFDRAVKETGEALQLRPPDAFGAVYQATHGLALLASQRFEEALPHLRASVIPFTEYMGHYNTLISCCGHLGRHEEARRWLDFRHKALGRPFALDAAAAALSGFAHADTFVEGLRRAGVS